MHQFLEVRLEQDLESRFQCMLSGENSSCWSVQHNKFSIHAHKSHVQDALPWWKTDQLGTFLIGRGKQTKCILGERLQPNAWISNMSSWDNTCVTTILKNVLAFLECSLINLIWFGEPLQMAARKKLGNDVWDDSELIETKVSTNWSQVNSNVWKLCKDNIVTIL